MTANLVIRDILLVLGAWHRLTRGTGFGIPRRQGFETSAGERFRTIDLGSA